MGNMLFIAVVRIFESTAYFCYTPLLLIMQVAVACANGLVSSENSLPSDTAVRLGMHIKPPINSNSGVTKWPY